MRPSWIEIDLDAIEHNARVIAAHIAPAELCAVVKADAYGHGDIPVARAALRGGAGLLAVALVEEGVRLREADIDVPVLVLSEPTTPEVASIIAHCRHACQIPASGYLPHVAFAAALAEAGQISEAQATVEKAIQLQPALSIGFIRGRFIGMHEITLKSLLDSLRKAGVPE